MLDREYETAFRPQSRMDRFQKSREIANIMKRQRTIDEIEARFGKFQLFHVRLNIADSIIRRIAARAFEHVFRKVVTDDRGRALLAGEAGEPAETATEIGNVTACQVGQKGTDKGPFRCAVQPVDRARQLTVGSEEIVAVINVLGHGLSFGQCEFGPKRDEGGCKAAAHPCKHGGA